MTTETILQIAGLLISGGVVTKAIDAVWISKKDKTDSDLQAKRESVENNVKLIEQLQDLVIQNINRQNELQKDLDYWRREYNELHKQYLASIEENSSLKTQVDTLTKKLEEMQRKYNQLTRKEVASVVPS